MRQAHKATVNRPRLSTAGTSTSITVPASLSAPAARSRPAGASQGRPGSIRRVPRQVCAAKIGAALRGASSSRFSSLGNLVAAGGAPPREPAGPGPAAGTDVSGPEQHARVRHSGAAHRRQLRPQDGGGHARPGQLRAVRLAVARGRGRDSGRTGQLFGRLLPGRRCERGRRGGLTGCPQSGTVRRRRGRPHRASGTTREDLR